MSDRNVKESTSVPVNMGAGLDDTQDPPSIHDEPMDREEDPPENSRIPKSPQTGEQFGKAAAGVGGPPLVRPVRGPVSQDKWG